MFATNKWSLVGALVGLMWLGTTPSARAEDYVPASSGKRYTPIEGPELRALAGATVGVPIFLDADRDVVKPGGEMNFWVGLDMEWLAFTVGFGASWTPIDLGAVPGATGFGQDPLARLFIPIEMRIQVPVYEPLLPFISAGFDANWWRHRDSQGLDCAFWYCQDRSSFTFAPGFTAKAGLGVKVGRRMYLDLGTKASFTGSGNFFQATEWFITPFLGITYRSNPG